MDSITQNNENENKNVKRYLPHDINTKYHAVLMYLNNNDIEYTCRKYHISRYSLWRWVKKYKGTKESLEDKSHKPKTRHPKSHTNQESNSWTDCLFETAVDGNYNIIFERTGRNLKLLQKMLNKMKNYKIIIRGMAVNELNCLMSIIERYEGQVNEKGWGRLVTIDHFYKAYSEMLETIDELEKLRIADSVEVYIRGEKPSEPTRIYSSKTKEYQGVRQAVIAGRQLDERNALNYYYSNFKNQIRTNRNSAEQDILEKIEQLYNSNCIEK